LKEALNLAAINEVLNKTIEHLIEQPEHETAAMVLANLPSHVATLESRCDELPQLLDTTHYSNASLGWSS
jgi:hypothetical protein